MPKITPFENYFNEYEEWFDKNKFVYLSEIKAVKHFIPKNRTGIEIGAGSGKFSEPLGIQYGVEPSDKMAEI
ncbi:MAG: SAM-dependent methyltransferase, partial [Acidobacteriota bacterium]|nr:SAM-dependent methyltransferase [Acidobacteriota bacterium]